MASLNLTGDRKSLLFVSNRTELEARYPENGVAELFQELGNKARLLEVTSANPLTAIWTVCPSCLSR